MNSTSTGRNTAIIISIPDVSNQSYLFLRSAEIAVPIFSAAFLLGYASMLALYKLGILSPSLSSTILNLGTVLVLMLCALTLRAGISNNMRNVLTFASLASVCAGTMFFQCFNCMP